MVDSNVVEKIRKLLALSHSANENEATMAAEKAQEILFKHGLSMAEVEAFADHTSHQENPEMRDFNLENKASEGQWKGYLLNGIARSHFCQIVLCDDTDGGKKAYTFGYPEDIETVVVLYEWIKEQLVHFHRVAWKGYCGSQKRNAFRRAFMMVASVRIAQRLKTKFDQLAAQSIQSTALVRNKDLAVNRMKNDIFPKLHRTKSTLRVGSDGAIAGMVAGGMVGLSGGKRLVSGQPSLTGRM